MYSEMLTEKSYKITFSNGRATAVQLQQQQCKILSR